MKNRQVKTSVQSCQNVKRVTIPWMSKPFREKFKAQGFRAKSLQVLKQAAIQGAEA